MILEIVLIVLAIFVLVIASILLIPFHVFASGSFDSAAGRFDLRVTWLGITFWHSKPRARKEEKAKSKREAPSIGRLFRIISAAAKSYPAIEILIRSVKRAIRVRRLSADLTFGTGDPADTALIAGYLWSFSCIVGRMLPPARLSIQPDLVNTTLDGSLDMEAGIRLLFLVGGFLRAYTKKSFRQLISEIRRSR